MSPEPDESIKSNYSPATRLLPFPSISNSNISPVLAETAVTSNSIKEDLLLNVNGTAGD